ncbi:MAG: serine/threonine-protein kinase [Myxococcota bacterium]
MIAGVHQPTGSVPSTQTAVHSVAARAHDDALLGDADRAPPTFAEQRMLSSLRSRLFGTAPQRAPTASRYVLLEPLGSGGFGMVYRAHDPELERDVAIKVVDSRKIGRRRVAAASRQLQLEAQAVAALSHPNIVAVHDVGLFGEEGSRQMFMVMELVAGKTMAAWLRGPPKSWRAALKVFIPAGRGLAAAHAAGVVHRDFKPANVIIADDGQPRVLDFGLARHHNSTGDSSEGGEVRRLERAGWVIGTPAYMAPEARRGEPTDPRSDQYSFCVSLHQALYGWRPSAEDLATPRTGDRVCNSGPRVPAWLARAVRRGLAEDAAQRFASMDELLDVLERGRGRQVRRRWQVAGVAVVAALTAAAAASDPEEVCMPPHGSLAGIWDGARRAEVRHALLATQVAHAGQSWPRVRSRLDAYADDWIEAHVASCRASHIEGSQSPEDLDLRTACLSRARHQLGALVDVFANARARTADHAVVAATKLPDLDRCSDVTALRASVAPPSPETAPAVEAIRRDLARARVVLSAGDFEAGTALAQASLVEANAVRYAPLQAEARFLVAEGHGLQGAIDTSVVELEDVYAEANAAGHDRLALQVAVELVLKIGSFQGRVDEGLRWARQAESVVTRVGAQRSSLHAQLESAIGGIKLRQGDVAGAHAAVVEALEIQREAVGTEHVDYATMLGNLAVVEAERGLTEQAVASLRRAIDVQEDILGPGHPTLAMQHANAGGLALRLGRVEDANRSLRRGLQIAEDSFGNSHPLTATACNNLGAALNDQGQTREARRYLERARAIWEKLDNPELGMALINIGIGYALDDDHARALTVLLRARDVIEERFGQEHRRAGTVAIAIAQASEGLGDDEAARREYERGIEVVTRTAPGDPELTTPLCGLATLHARAGRHDEVEAAASRCLALATAHGNTTEAERARELLRSAP